MRKTFLHVIFCRQQKSSSRYCTTRIAHWIHPTVLSVVITKLRGHQGSKKKDTTTGKGTCVTDMVNMSQSTFPSFSGHTLRTILLSEVGVLPTHSANLQASPSTCSVTPSSEVWRKKDNYVIRQDIEQRARKSFLVTRGQAALWRHNDTQSLGLTSVQMRKFCS